MNIGNNLNLNNDEIFNEITVTKTPNYSLKLCYTVLSSQHGEDTQRECP